MKTNVFEIVIMPALLSNMLCANEKCSAEFEGVDVSGRQHHVSVCANDNRPAELAACNAAGTYRRSNRMMLVADGIMPASGRSCFERSQRSLRCQLATKGCVSTLLMGHQCTLPRTSRVFPRSLKQEAFGQQAWQRWCRCQPYTHEGQ